MSRAGERGRRWIAQGGRGATGMEQIGGTAPRPPPPSLIARTFPGSPSGSSASRTPLFCNETHQGGGGSGEAALRRWHGTSKFAKQVRHPNQQTGLTNLVCASAQNAPKTRRRAPHPGTWKEYRIAPKAFVIRSGLSGRGGGGAQRLERAWARIRGASAHSVQPRPDKQQRKDTGTGRVRVRIAVACMVARPLTHRAPGILHMRTDWLRVH